MSHEPWDDDGGECAYCGGEGFVFYCFDGCCEDADIGCDDCTEPCSHCGIKTRTLPDGLSEVLGEALKQKAQR
jgi:hypothetical protein